MIFALDGRSYASGEDHFANHEKGIVVSENGWRSIHGNISY